MRRNDATAMRLALLSPILLAAACSASSPGEDVRPDAGPTVDEPGDVALEIDGLPPTTIYSSLPVRGRGPARGTLVYDVPARGQFSAELGQDGNFCVDVPLQRESANSLRFQAIDGDGIYSDPVVVSTTQAGSPPEPEETDVDSNGVRNISRGSTMITTDTSVTSGTLELLTDGNKTTPVELNDSTIDWDSNRVTLRFTEQASVYGAKVTTATDCPMQQFSWYLSNSDVEPTASEQWTYQGYVDESKTEHLLWPSLAEPTAQWLYIDFESTDCGSWWAGGVHRLVELEVFTRDDAPGQAEPPPQNPNPTCASGGDGGGRPE